MNLRSLVNKCFEFKNYIATVSPDIICVTETFLDSTITNELFLINGYSAFRCDRNRHGGGVLVLVKSTLGAFSLSFQPMCECVLIDCVSDITKFRIVSIYRGDLSRECLINIFDAIDYANNTTQALIILGDFNFPMFTGIRCN